MALVDIVGEHSLDFQTLCEIVHLVSYHEVSLEVDVVGLLVAHIGDLTEYVLGVEAVSEEESARMVNVVGLVARMSVALENHRIERRCGVGRENDVARTAAGLIDVRDLSAKVDIDIKILGDVNVEAGTEIVPVVAAVGAVAVIEMGVAVVTVLVEEADHRIVACALASSPEGQCVVLLDGRTEGIVEKVNVVAETVRVVTLGPGPVVNHLLGVHLGLHVSICLPVRIVILEGLVVESRVVGRTEIIRIGNRLRDTYLGLELYGRLLLRGTPLGGHDDDTVGAADTVNGCR